VKWTISFYPIFRIRHYPEVMPKFSWEMPVSSCFQNKNYWGIFYWHFPEPGRNVTKTRTGSKNEGWNLRFDGFRVVALWQYFLNFLRAFRMQKFFELFRLRSRLGVLWTHDFH